MKKLLSSIYLEKIFYVKHSILFFSLFLTGCISNYLPIARVDRKYPPTNISVIVEEVPESAIFIGKLKLVPSDNSISFNEDRAIAKLKKCACEYGARYICITHMESSGTDYRHTHFDRSFGDGITIEAKLYR